MVFRTLRAFHYNHTHPHPCMLPPQPSHPHSPSPEVPRRNGLDLDRDLVSLDDILNDASPDPKARDKRAGYTNEPPNDNSKENRVKSRWSFSRRGKTAKGVQDSTTSSSSSSSSSSSRSWWKRATKRIKRAKPSKSPPGSSPTAPAPSPHPSEDTPASQDTPVFRTTTKSPVLSRASMSIAPSTSPSTLKSTKSRSVRTLTRRAAQHVTRRAARHVTRRATKSTKNISRQFLDTLLVFVFVLVLLLALVVVLPAKAVWGWRGWRGEEFWW